MFNNYLTSIEGVSIYPVISLVLFFVIFSVIVIWALKLDKKYINKMESLPLENKKNIETKNESN
ncbi:cbb3-type cytochrome c oxidase subunit 3 [Melioribacteraceae bacterium 4301-Me]|uniref:cbb3-type cytochrome c oxidase subunit 3 n=1 Tax=Pyranulibacter aquaticus TaxID=3163344 RepID=UPI003598F3F6